MNAKRTTIIISNLSRAECLTVPAVIKSEIHALQIRRGAPEIIEQWSELSFLSRLVISITTEDYAQTVYDLLTQQHPELKIHLSECFVRRNKSFDATLQTPVSPNLSKYEEPEPVKSDDESVISLGASTKMTTPRKRTLVEGLRLDTSITRTGGKISPMSPTITLEQVENF